VTETETTNLFFRIFDAPSQGGADSQKSNILTHNRAKVRRQILLAKSRKPDAAEDIPMKDESSEKQKDAA